MKKIILLLVGFLFVFTLSPQKALAQSPIRCGLMDEPCCDFAGSKSPCSEEKGLVCEGGTCIPLDPDNVTPDMYRGGVTPKPQDTDIEDAEKKGIEKVLCDDGVSIDTAIGCIPIGDTNALIGFILSWAIGIGGGIAFLLIIFAAFQIMTSSGNPDRLKAGQELMTSAIAGLILLIFSTFILRIIGVNILGILPEV
jgi:hypothetical protein